MTHRARVLRALTAILSVLTVLAAALVVAGPARAASSELLFSEYVEGSSNNKALEIFNGTGAPVNLGAGGYNVQMAFNGNTTPSLTIALTGEVADGDVFVLAQASAGATIQAIADQTNGAGWFNGDDAVLLRKGSTIIDSIGQLGVDPGTEWGGGLTSTADNTLHRKAAVTDGDATPGDAFDPGTQWDGFAQDTFYGLGARTGDATPEVRSTNPADGGGDVLRTGNVVVNFSEPVDAAGDWFSISCSTTGAHAATVSGGPTSYTLDPATDFAFGETCTVTVRAAQVTDQDTQDPPSSPTGDYTFSFTTVEQDPCDVDYTPIHELQGSAAATPFPGQTKTTEGVVVGDFQGGSGLNGFFLQDATGDGNTATSDGIFVFVPAASPFAGVDVEVGDVVHLTGRITEFNTLTEIDFVSALKTCGSVQAPAPTEVTLPEQVNGDLEDVEGMLVSVSGPNGDPLTVQQNFFQGRFGQVTLGAGGRLFQPTNQFAPGSAGALALADLNQRSLLVLDDGFGGQNPNPIPYIGEDNTLRAGDAVTTLTGVIDWGSINSNSAIRDYRLHPTTAPTFTRVNGRTAAPEPVGGNLKVSAFNVLNYFTTFTGPDARGANNQAEFDRQRDKIINAMSAIDADVFGLMEIENNQAAIADLVAGLNDKMGAGTYAAVSDTGLDVGDDAIKVAMIYKPAAVTPVGPAMSKPDDAFTGFGRVPVAQTFELNANGGRVSVVVNHFKSKSCSPTPSGGDVDSGDGTGCFNARRVLQAGALLEFVDEIKAASHDDDVLVIGDLNAYAKEAPISDLEQGGLHNEIERFLGDDAYSFVFDGMSGYLDHGLASESAHGQVVGTTEWHINADEPSVIDYNTEFKPQDLYQPTPYRSSDHDPVVLGLDLGQCSYEDQGSTRTLTGNCATSRSVHVPDGVTLDGAGFAITAEDPVGGHFLGAVVANGGDEAHVTNLTVTVDSLADACDGGVDRLRGILLDGAAGSIVDNQVLGINQGASGCQEGNGIEVRNAPFDRIGPDKTVTVTGNKVSDYQKTGILANGSVNVTVIGNTVEGVGPVDYIAQNGIQLGFGATGLVDGNSMSDNFYTGADVACGLLLFEADGVKQKRNTFAGNERDVCNFGRGGGGSASS